MNLPGLVSPTLGSERWIEEVILAMDHSILDGSRRDNHPDFRALKLGRKFSNIFLGVIHLPYIPTL
jgi:hypothetical protein